MEFSLDRGATWFTFEKSGDTALLEGLAALTAPREYSFDLRLRVDGTELPGEYEGELVFTLTTQ